jgi:hypothetical protein
MTGNLTRDAFAQSSIVTVALLLVATVAGHANAQTPGRFYVGGSIGGFSVNADHVDGRSPAAGVVGGVSLKSWLDIEGEIVIPTRHFTRIYGGDVVSYSFAPPGSPDFERLGVILEYHNERDVSMSISGVAIFHGSVHPRVEVGFIAGITNHRVTDRTVRTPVRVGDGLDPTHLVQGSDVHTRNLGGPTFGANVAVALTRHLRIVPDIRFDYGSFGDEINNALRTSVRVHWRF